MGNQKKAPSSSWKSSSSGQNAKKRWNFLSEVTTKATEAFKTVKRAVFQGSDDCQVMELEDQVRKLQQQVDLLVKQNSYVESTTGDSKTPFIVRRGRNILKMCDEIDEKELAPEKSEEDNIPKVSGFFDSIGVMAPVLYSEVLSNWCNFSFFGNNANNTTRGFAAPGSYYQHNQQAYNGNSYYNTGAAFNYQPQYPNYAPIQTNSHFVVNNTTDNTVPLDTNNANKSNHLRRLSSQGTTEPIHSIVNIDETIDIDLYPKKLFNSAEKRAMRRDSMETKAATAASQRKTTAMDSTAPSVAAETSNSTRNRRVSFGKNTVVENDSIATRTRSVTKTSTVKMEPFAINNPKALDVPVSITEETKRVETSKQVITNNHKMTSFSFKQAMSDLNQEAPPPSVMTFDFSKPKAETDKPTQIASDVLEFSTGKPKKTSRSSFARAKPASSTTTSGSNTTTTSNTAGNAQRRLSSGIPRVANNNNTNTSNTANNTTVTSNASNVSQNASVNTSNATNNANNANFHGNNNDFQSVNNFASMSKNTYNISAQMTSNAISSNKYSEYNKGDENMAPNTINTNNINNTLNDKKSNVNAYNFGNFNNGNTNSANNHNALSSNANKPVLQSLSTAYSFKDFLMEQNQKPQQTTQQSHQTYQTYQTQTQQVQQVQQVSEKSSLVRETIVKMGERNNKPTNAELVERAFQLRQKLAQM